MDRSAVIRSMDRERLRKVSDPYPLEFFLANHKRLAVMLYQCDLQGFLGTLQLQVQAQTHTHTPHGSAGSCQKMASPLSLHPPYTAGSSLPCNHDRSERTNPKGHGHIGFDQ